MVGETWSRTGKKDPKEKLITCSLLPPGTCVASPPLGRAPSRRRGPACFRCEPVNQGLVCSYWISVQLIRVHPRSTLHSIANYQCLLLSKICPSGCTSTCPRFTRMLHKILLPSRRCSGTDSVTDFGSRSSRLQLGCHLMPRP